MIFNGNFAFFSISCQFAILFNGNFTFFLVFIKFPCYSMGYMHFSCFFVNFPSYSMGIWGLESFGGGMDRRTDIWKFTPVSYRTSALWGRCPKRKHEKNAAPVEIHGRREMNVKKNRLDAWRGKINASKYAHAHTHAFNQLIPKPHEALRIKLWNLIEFWTSFVLIIFFKINFLLNRPADLVEILYT